MAHLCSRVIGSSMELKVFAIRITRVTNPLLAHWHVGDFVVRTHSAWAGPTFELGPHPAQASFYGTFQEAETARARNSMSIVDVTFETVCFTTQRHY